MIRLEKYKSSQVVFIHSSLLSLTTVHANYGVQEVEVFIVFILPLLILKPIMVKGGPGASGRVLPPVTGRSWVRVAVSSHCTGEGKACH